MLSEVNLRRGDLAAALKEADHAITLYPEALPAYVMRAKCLLKLGEYSSALIAAEAGVKLRGDAAAEWLDGLGAIFGMLGRHQQALVLFRRAVAIAPGNAQFLFNLAASERIVGSLAEAETHCDALLKIDPLNALAHGLRADLRIQTPERNHIVEFERVMSKGVRNWQDEVILRYALGKEYEDLGRFAEAFREIEAGAALQRLHVPHDVAPELSFIARVQQTQTKDWLGSVSSTGRAAAAPVFVVGLPRSGTTVVERILTSHSALHSVGELGAVPLEVARAFRASPRAPDLRAIGRRTTEAADAVAPGARFVDKTLQNFLYCGLILAALPNAKIILVRRRPMDSCWALYKTHFQNTFRYSYDQMQLAEYFLAFRRLADHWQATLPADSFTQVHYEAVVRDQVAESRRLISFLGLHWEDGVLQFHESAAPSTTASAVQVRRPLYASSIGLWRHYRAALAPLYSRLASELPADELDPPV